MSIEQTLIQNKRLEEHIRITEWLKQNMEEKKTVNKETSNKVNVKVKKNKS